MKINSNVKQIEITEKGRKRHEINKAEEEYIN